MQVTELKNEGLKRSFQVSIDAQKIERATEEELKSAGAKLKMPGFRPGFVPMKVLKQRFGKEVERDVLRNLVDSTTQEILKERSLRPAISPQIKIAEDYKEGSNLDYTLDMEVMPEVPTVTYEGININRAVVEVEDAEIDKALATLAERSPKLSARKPDETAQDGDVLTIDFKGMIDGVAFDGGTAEGATLKLGSKQFIDNFEDQLIGTKAGDDKIVTVTFPEEYGAKELAGKKASFEVKVQEIQAATNPEMNDAFGKEKGFADLQGLKDAIRDQMKREYNQVIRTKLKKQLFDELETRVDFELPASMMEMEFNAIWERVQQAKKEGESFEDKSEDALREEYRKIAARRVKLGILLAEIGTKENFQVTREEISQAVMQQASQFPGQERMVMDFYQKNPEQLRQLQGPIMEEKAVDYILAQVNYTDTPTTVEALMKDDEESESKPEGKAAKKTSKKNTKEE